MRLQKLPCPHCGVSLRGRLLRCRKVVKKAKGFTFTNPIAYICPLCGKEFYENLQPAHILIKIVFTPFIVGFFSIFIFKDNITWLYIMLFAVIFGLAGLLVIYFKFLRGQPRFSAVQKEVHFKDIWK